MRKRLHQFTDLLANLAGHLISRALRRTTQPRRRAKRPVRCWFERLEAREVFNATYHGGALLPHVEAQAVYLGSDWNTNSTEIAFKPQLDAYLAYLVQSTHMDLMTDHGFNVGQGTATAGITLPVTLSKTSTATGGVSDATIRADLQAAITSKLIDQPTQNKLYVVFVEQGVVIHNGADTSATTFLGYHTAFAGSDASNVPFDIRYAVIAYPNDAATTGFNPTAASQGFGNEFQELTLGGASGGTLKPSFNNVSATTNITRTDEVQTLTVGGVDGGTIRLAYQNIAGTAATKLTVQAGVSPTAADVLNQLNSISALTNNVQVTGGPGGPFAITFTKGLTGVNVAQLVAVTDGGATASIATPTEGSPPTAAQVEASLNSIAALANKVAVSGGDGGPFIIAILSLGNAAPINVTTVSGNLTGAVVTLADGEDTVTSDFDQLTSVLSHELSEAVTDPDVNYKTLGWYDDVNNVENGDLTLSSLADRFTVSTRLNGYLTQNLFVQDGTVAAPDATSTIFSSRILPDDITVTTALQNVVVQTLSLSRAQVSWTPVDGAVGYRVFLVNGTQTTLLSRVPASQSSTILTGLPQLTNLTFRVEAYNAAHVTDPVSVSLTLPLPNLTAPQHVVASNNLGSNTSVNLTWNASPGAAGYRVFMISGTTKKLVATLGEAATSATVGGLKAGTTVSFRVEAFRGSKVADSALVSIKLTTPGLAAPVLTASAIAGNNKAVQLNWNTVAGAKGYRIYWLNGSHRVLLSSLSATATTTRISGLPAGTQFQVEAFSGSNTAASNWAHV